MKALKIVGLIVAVLVVFAAGFLSHPAYDSYKEKQATSAANDFLTALTSGDTAKAYSLTSKTMQSNQTEAQFADNVGNVKSSNVQFSGQFTTVHKSNAFYQAVAKNLPADQVGNTTATFNLGLVQQGGKWVVDSVNVQ